MPKVTQLMATTLQDVKLQQDLLLCPLGARPCSHGMSLNPSSGTVLLPAQVQGGDVIYPKSWSQYMRDQGFESCLPRAPKLNLPFVNIGPQPSEPSVSNSVSSSNTIYLFSCLSSLDLSLWLLSIHIKQYQVSTPVLWPLDGKN